MFRFDRNGDLVKDDYFPNVPTAKLFEEFTKFLEIRKWIHKHQEKLKALDEDAFAKTMDLHKDPVLCKMLEDMDDDPPNRASICTMIAYMWALQKHLLPDGEFPFTKYDHITSTWK